MRVKQSKEFICCFPWTGRCSAIPRRAGLHHKSQLLRKTNSTIPNATSSSFFLLVSILGMKSHGLEYPFGQFGSLSVCVSSQSPKQPQSPHQNKKFLGEISLCLSFALHLHSKYATRICLS